MQCKIHGCDREQNAPLCGEHRRQYGGFMKRRPPKLQLAYMRALCSVHPLTGCWIPMSGKWKCGNIIMSYGNVYEDAHRIIARLTQRCSWPIHPQIVLHSDVCEYIRRRELVDVKCWNPDHLTIGTHSDNGKARHRVSQLLARFANGETDEQIIAELLAGSDA